jgi:regulator of cell morphogenesis and NO signaling
MAIIAPLRHRIVAPLLDVDGTTEDWVELGPAALADHLERVHHAYLWDELRRLAALADQVLDAHGTRHPELTPVRRLLHEFELDLEPVG